MLRDELADHLKRFPAAPFLFVGAGVGRRYLNLPDWKGLLQEYAAVVGREYEYYASTADGDYPKTASLIAADLHEKWWSNEHFAEIREAFKGYATTPQSSLQLRLHGP